MTREIPLCEVPKVFEKAVILEGSVLEEYDASLEPLNERARKWLKQYTVVDGELVGSSPLMQIHLLNSGVLPKEDRLATRLDLEKAIVFDDEKKVLGTTYTDFGLALKTAGDNYDIDGAKVNNAIAKRLANQLERREIALDEGVLIPFSALTDISNEEEYWGLTLDLNDFATRDTIRHLKEFEWTFSRKEGLSCASLDGGRYWDFVDEHLGRSDGDGRVVVIRAEGTPEKILGERTPDDYAQKVQSSKKEYTEKLIKLKDQIDAEIRRSQ